MTIRMYADHKGIALDGIRAEVLHEKVHADDCADCAENKVQKGGKVDRFERRIALSGKLDEDTRNRLLEIADKCPVHKTLEASAVIVTQEVDQGD